MTSHADALLGLMVGIHADKCSTLTTLRMAVYLLLKKGGGTEGACELRTSGSGGFRLECLNCYTWFSPKARISHFGCHNFLKRRRLCLEHLRKESQRHKSCLSWLIVSGLRGRAFLNRSDLNRSEIREAHLLPKENRNQR
jgi:hypothetical protein